MSGAKCVRKVQSDPQRLHKVFALKVVIRKEKERQFRKLSLGSLVFPHLRFLLAASASTFPLLLNLSLTTECKWASLHFTAAEEEDALLFFVVQKTIYRELSTHLTLP